MRPAGSKRLDMHSPPGLCPCAVCLRQVFYRAGSTIKRHLQLNGHMDDLRNNPECANHQTEEVNNSEEVNNPEGTGAGEDDENSQSDLDSESEDLLSNSSEVEAIEREAINKRGDVLHKMWSKPPDHEVRVFLYVVCTYP